MGEYRRGFKSDSTTECRYACDDDVNDGSIEPSKYEDKGPFPVTVLKTRESTMGRIWGPRLAVSGSSQ